MAGALKAGSWICAIYVIFIALVWLVGGFLVTNAISNGAQAVAGLELVPQLFWPVRAIIAALGVVGAIILVLSRPAFLRVLTVWFSSELCLLIWLYGTGFLSSQFETMDDVRNLAIWQICNFAVIMFAWVKHRALFQTASLSE
ncbi:MAG: hypothetical protein OIF56_00185 [Cohaesibacter sp.]|nr:hypothetical protein [Cohaesibacter sp.]MCV6602741.1 hypothetical protein [Cohaesibacter sp.]